MSEASQPTQGLSRANTQRRTAEELIKASGSAGQSDKRPHHGPHVSSVGGTYTLFLPTFLLVSACQNSLAAFVHYEVYSTMSQSNFPPLLNPSSFHQCPPRISFSHLQVQRHKADLSSSTDRSETEVFKIPQKLAIVPRRRERGNRSEELVARGETMFGSYLQSRS